ncbi:MAG TPA: preprotein translocase subunit YajC [Gemmatimonadales bacterium]
MNALPVHASLLAIQAAPGGGMAVLLIQFALIFAIFYFLMIRPQRKQRQEHEARLRTLKRGDEVVTAGGVVGEIVHIAQGQKDGESVAAMDDHITIKSGESRLIVERGRIARVGGVSGPATPGSQ